MQCLSVQCWGWGQEVPKTSKEIRLPSFGKRESFVRTVSPATVTPALWYAAHLCAGTAAGRGRGAGPEPCTLAEITPSPFLSLQSLLHRPFVSLHPSGHLRGPARARG